MMAAIAGAAVSSGAVEAVTRRSAGVPFVVEELMRCIGPDTGGGDVFEVQLPWSLEEAVRHQLAGLGAVERTIVDALAVLAEPSGFEVVAAVVVAGRRGAARRVARPDGARRRGRTPRRPPLVRPCARGRLGPAPAARPRAPTAPRAVLRRAAGAHPRRSRGVGPARARCRPLRRDRGHRPPRRTPVPRPWRIVPGAAPGLRGPGRGRRTARPARRRHGGGVAARLPAGGAHPRPALARARDGRARPHRRPALRGAVAARAGRPGGGRRGRRTARRGRRSLRARRHDRRTGPC